MKKIYTSVFIATLLLQIYSCSCKDCAKSDYEITIPQNIIDKGIYYIMSKTGKDFLSKYIGVDYINSKQNENNCELIFHLRMIENNFVDEVINLEIDKNGEVISEKGIPDCVKDSSNCIFVIDENKVLEIIEKSGLKTGIRKNEVEFRWSKELQKYVWHILSFHNESEEDGHYKGNGQEMMISPKDGEILLFREWIIE
ncbi:MAG: hypothetical protein PVH88_11470 [Ignavibacteria bacterium]|jgi:hypothetical protein